MNSLIRICCLGNVDSGKSTLFGVLLNNKLDNGKGEARLSTTKLKHELISGNTSCINSVRISDRLYFIDLAGHYKYFGTTLRGLNEYRPDFSLILINSNKGIEIMTKNHILSCYYLRIPIIILITKIDISPEDKIYNTMKNVQKYLKQIGCKYLFEIKNEDTLTRGLNAMNKDTYITNVYIPLFKISNVTGIGLDLFKNFINKIENKHNYLLDINNLKQFSSSIDLNNVFEIYKTYTVPGIGLVVFGINKIGTIKKNDKLLVGPIKNQYINIRVRSLHNDKREEVNMLCEGMQGCLAIKYIEKDIINKHNIRKGKVITDKFLLITEIDTECKITNHSTTITKKYRTVIYTGNISASASIKEAEKLPIRTGDLVKITFEFLYPQFIYPGNRFLFRDDNIKGFGNILNIKYK